MGRAVLLSLLNFVLKLVQFMGNLIFRPTMILVQTFFPDIDNSYITSVTDFFSSRIFPFATWIKGLFLNITGFPNALFIILVTQLLAFFAAAVAVRILFFVYNLYYFIRGSKL